MKDQIDDIRINIPLLIRILEWAREESKSDIQVHKVVERIIKLSKIKSPLTMNNYLEIIDIKEIAEITELRKFAGLSK